MRQRERQDIARTVLPVGHCQRPVPRSRGRAVGELLIVVVVNPATAQPSGGRNLPVNANDVLSPRVGARNLRSVVVRIAARRRVRRGKEFEDRLPAVEEAIRRNYVQASRVVERRARGIAEAGHLDASATGAAELRVFDENLVSAPVHRLREIAAALGVGGDANVHRRSLGHELAVILLVDEEEELPLLLRADERHRAAEIPTVVVEAVQWARESILRAAARVVEEGVGVQAVVAAEVATGAMVFVRARARGERDETSAGTAILSLIIRGENLDLFERVRIDRDQSARVVAQIVVGHAVNRVLVLGVARAVNGEAAGNVGDGRSSAPGGRAAGDNAGNEPRQINRIAPVETDAAKLLARNQVGALARLGLDLQLARVSLNLNRLSHLADFEREVARVELVRRAQNDVALLYLLEALLLDADRVYAGRKLGRDEDSVSVSGHRPRDAVGRIDDSDGRARDGRTVAVFDLPGDRAVALAECDDG